MTLQQSYFDDVYAGRVDPFRLDDNWYEERKYALTLASLPKKRYRRALEPGCSIGLLTAGLAGRCDELVSTDIVDAALTTARSRNAGHAVDFVSWSLTDDWATVSMGRTFDLIVLSEVCYYLDATDLRAAADSAVAHLDPGGTLLAAHWRHPVADYPQTGDAVHAALRATAGLTHTSEYSDEDVIIDVFLAGTEPVDSVARAGGLV